MINLRKKLLVIVLVAMPLLSCADIWTQAEDDSRQKSSLTYSTCTASPFEGGMSVYSNAENLINLYLNDGTEYAVYLAYPQQSDDFYSYNSHPMRSASMIKVFILEYVMHKVAQGDVDLDEIMTLHESDMVGGSGILAGYGDGAQLPLQEVLRLMIAESDNTATNMIIDKFGMDNINNYISGHGYSNTILQRKMMDQYAIGMGWENYSSVEDLGLFFNRVYQHNCVSYDLDNLMLEFLIGQTDTDCFPAALPNKTIAHKTGALAGLYDDGGIIYQNGNDVILVIMTENYCGEYTTISHMKNFVQAVVES